jgi:hypothetical protein
MKRLLRLSFLLVFLSFFNNNSSYGSSIIKYLEKNTMMSSSEESSGVPTPPSPSQTQYCGYTKLTRSTPPSGTTYYWQTSSTGTSTSNSSSTYNMYNNGYVYLRAKNGDTWSSARSVYVNVKQSIANPTVNTSVSRCGSGTVSMAATPPTNAYIKWYQGSTYKSSNETYSPTISTTTTYTVKSYQNGCYSSGVNVTATVKARPSIPTASNKSRCGAGTVALTATPPSGATVKWYEGSTYRATGNSYSPSISSTKTYTVKAVKDGCYSGGRNVTATVKEIPYVSISTNNERCGTGNIDLNTTPSPSTATVVWETVSGGTFYTGNTYTANLTSEGDDVTYKVYASLNGCNSTKGTISATSKPIPAIPTASNKSRCGTGTLALSATPPSGATIKWYQGSTYKASGNSYTTPSISSTTTYTAKSVLDGCYSSGKSVVASVKAIPANPTTSDKSRCGNGTVTLSATPPSGATVKWYAAGIYKATGNSYTTPSITNNTTYTAKSEKDGCYSGGKNVIAIVKALPANPTTSSKSRCGSGTVTFTATPPSGSSVKWYLGSTEKGTGNSYTTPTISSSTSYIAKSYNNECHSIGASVTATIKAIPANPTVVHNSRCGSGTVTLSATPPTGATIAWFEGSTEKGTGNSYTTPTISSTKIYTAKSVKDGCNSGGLSVTATIKEIPYMQITPNQEFCGLENNELTVTPIPSSAMIVWMKGGGTVYTGNSKPAEFTDYGVEDSYNVYASLNGCNSGTGTVSGIAKFKPAKPIVPSKSKFGEGSFTFDALTAQSDVTIEWLEGGTLLHAGESYTTGNLTNTKNYSIRATSNTTGCKSDLNSFTAEIIIPANINTLKSPVENGDIHVSDEYYHALDQSLEAYYEFDLLKYAQLEISHDGSGATGTKYSVMKKPGQPIYSNVGNPAPVDNRLLSPGTYYVKVEGHNTSTGVVKTTINVTEREGCNTSNAIPKSTLTPGYSFDIVAINTSNQGYGDNYSSDILLASNADDIYYSIPTSDRVILKAKKGTERTLYHIVDASNVRSSEIFHKDGFYYFDLRPDTDYHLIVESDKNLGPGRLELEVGVESPDDFFAAHSFDRFYAINSGDWGNPNVWSYSPNGSPADRTPAGEDIVYIDGQTITTNMNITCQDIILSNEYGNTALNVANGDLNVYGEIKLVAKKSTSINTCSVNLDPSGYIQVIP